MDETDLNQNREWKKEPDDFAVPNAIEAPIGWWSIQ